MFYSIRTLQHTREKRGDVFVKKYWIEVRILSGLLVVLGIVVTVKTSVPAFGVLMVLIAVITFVLTAHAETDEPEEEGDMVGCIIFETRGDELALYVDLEDLVSDAGLTEDVIANMQQSTSELDSSKDYYMHEAIVEDDGHTFLKRLILIRVDSFGNLKGLNVMLNGESYEATLSSDELRNLEVYLDDQFMMRLALADFNALAKAFSEDVALSWPKVEGSVSGIFEDEQN